MSIRDALYLLGIPEESEATKEAVKIAYRKFAKKYHPDINKDLDASEKFKQGKKAFDFLNLVLDRGLFRNQSRAEKVYYGKSYGGYTVYYTYTTASTSTDTR